MTSQAVINEIRESRTRMSRECGHDPSKLIAYLQRYNRKYATQVSQYQRRRRDQQPVALAEAD